MFGKKKPRAEVKIVPTSGKTVTREIDIEDGDTVQVIVRKATGQEATNLNISVNGTLVKETGKASIKAGDKVQVEERPRGS